MSDEIEFRPEELAEFIGKVFDEKIKQVWSNAKAEPEAREEINKMVAWKETIQKAITLGSLNLPAELYADVMQAVYKYGVIRANAIKVETNRSAKVPVMSEIAAYEVSETGSITEASNPISFKDFSLTKIASLVVLTPELIEAWDISDYIVRTMGLAIAKMEDKKGISNIASDTGTTAVTVTGLSALTYDNLVSMMSAVDVVFESNAMWVLGQSAYGQIYKLKDSAGRPLVDFQGGMNTLLGKKFIVVPDGIFPTDNYALYGSFDAVICAYENTLRIETFTSGVVGSLNLITNDAFAIRAVEKFNAMPVFSSGFAVLKNS